MKYQNRIVGNGEESLDQIMFNPRNWRIHPLHQQDALKGVLEEVGWVQQVIVNKRTGNLIDGHLRCQLAAREGNDTIPVVYVDLSEEEEALILSTLDPIAGMAATDKEKLDDLFRQFNSDNEDVQKLIADIAEKEKLEFGKKPIEDAEPQIDKAEELRVKWGVETGQMWKLGEHRIICGDCTDKAVVEKVMGGEVAELLFTSPPYMDAREYGGSDLEIEKIIEFIPAFVELVNLFGINLGIVRRDNTVVRYWDAYIEKAENSGLKLLSWNIWDRQQPWSMAQNTAMFPVEHEWIFVFGHSKKTLNLTIENKTPGKRTGITNRQKDGTLKKADTKEVRTHRALGTIFRSPPNIGKDIGHPAMFPVVLPEAYIEACTSDGELVAEPFSGSGTTLIACERLGRKCRAVEISPAYVAVSIQRWVDATGGVPELIEQIE